MSSRKEPVRGKIATFYSYKGGVGRTMALANIAFIAAYNNMKVLVMDWDLEAPGLAYYFRGLLDTQTAKELKESPGIMDILWDWSENVDGIDNEDALSKYISSFDGGEPFKKCTRSLVDHGLFSSNITLDYIGAGSKVIQGTTPIAYEEALASFSWSHFFEECAGGVVLEALKNWAKKNYDLVLIDSRTGLADVSGICTMQLPDVVALCFVLNRQNIDGVAKVAAAIRGRRKDNVILKAVPMRVSRRDTSEESDARARAISELTRIGGFPKVAVQDDLRSLYITADDNVPFYETLSPFTATDPALDPLTTCYVRLAKEITELELETPIFTDEFLSLIRRRLQPRQATVEYIVKLKGADPERAAQELQNLLDNAFQSDIDGDEIGVEYIRALIDTINLVAKNGVTFDAYSIKARVLDLLRSLTASSASIWKGLLVSELESYHSSFFMYFDEEEEVSLLEELDALLSEQDSAASLLARLKYRRRVASIYIRERNLDSSKQALSEITNLLKKLVRKFPLASEDYSEELAVAESDLLMLTGDACMTINDFSSAYNSYLSSLDVLDRKGEWLNEEVSQIRYSLYSKISELPRDVITSETAASFALNAVKVSPNAYYLIQNFAKLTGIIIQGGSEGNLVLDFCKVVMSNSVFRAQLPSSYGRQARLTSIFLNTVASIVDALNDAIGSEVGEVVDFWIEMTEQVLRQVIRRRETMSERQIMELTSPVIKVLDAFESFGVDTFSYTNLTLARKNFASKRLIENLNKKEV